MSYPEMPSAPPSPSNLPAMTDRQTQILDHHNPSPPDSTATAQTPVVGDSTTAAITQGGEGKTDASSLPMVPPLDPFAGFEGIIRHVEDGEFGTTSTTESSEQTTTAPVNTEGKTEQKSQCAADTAELAVPTARIPGTTPPPSVHFPDTLPVPVHEHHHHHHHHLNQSHHHHHHHSHHHHRQHHPNTPFTPAAQNPMDDAADITTPLPSYPSSGHISRTSSMRSLIISLETPSYGGSIFNDTHHHQSHTTQGLYDREVNGSENFGYRLGRRLDTLVSTSSREGEPITGDGGEGAECIHSLRRGIPMRLPLPTLVSEQRRGRTLSGLRNQVHPGSGGEEGAPSAGEEDPAARLNRMVEVQLHRTYEGLRKLANELEGCHFVQPPTPAEPQLETPVVLPVIDGEKHSETINSQEASTGVSTPHSPPSNLPVLRQLVLQRACADPQDLRQLAELNMRLLRNLQVSLRKLDKLTTLVQEQVAKGAGEVDGADQDEDEGDSDNGIFVPKEREGARSRVGRERSESREREEEENVAGRSPQMKVEKVGVKKSGTITVVTRALGLKKSKKRQLSKNYLTSSPTSDTSASSVPTGAIAPIPACNISPPAFSTPTQRRTLSWSSFWLIRKPSPAGDHPAPIDLDHSIPFNGMHGSCCTCGDKHRQVEAARAQAWGVSGFWRKGSGRLGTGVASGKERKLGTSLNGL